MWTQVGRKCEERRRKEDSFLHFIKLELLTFSHWRPWWKLQKVLHLDEGKKKSTQYRSQFLTWLVHLNSKDSLSTWAYVIKKWHPEHTCLLVLHTHLCIFVNCWGQDGWQVNISTLFSVMTTDSIWPSVFGWSPKCTGKGSKPPRAVLCSP